MVECLPKDEEILTFVKQMYIDGFMLVSQRKANTTWFHIYGI